MDIFSNIMPSEFAMQQLVQDLWKSAVLVSTQLSEVTMWLTTLSGCCKWCMRTNVPLMSTIINIFKLYSITRDPETHRKRFVWWCMAVCVCVSVCVCVRGLLSCQGDSGTVLTLAPVFIHLYTRKRLLRFLIRLLRCSMMLYEVCVSASVFSVR